MSQQKIPNAEKYSGIFDLTKNLHIRSKFGGLVDSSLRGVGQIFLINNPLTGLFMTVAIAFGSLWGALMLLAGSLISTAVAIVLRYDFGVIRLGFYSFNGALFGVLGAVFLDREWSLQNFTFTMLAAVVSVPLMKATIEFFVGGFDAPALSFAFGSLGILLLLLTPATAYGNANIALLQPVQRYAVEPDPSLRINSDSGQLDLAVGLFNATFRGISQVVLMDSVLVGLLIVVAIGLATRIGAIMVVLGSMVGGLTGIVIGADGFQVVHGLWGYNGAVVAVGLFGIVLETRFLSFILTLAAAACSALLYGALSELLNPYGVIPLSLPLVLVIIGTVLALKNSRINVIPIAEYATAENRLRLENAKTKERIQL